jgi:hypothetical protein
MKKCSYRYLTIVAYYKAKLRVNILIVDWRELSVDATYILAVSNTIPTGNQLADLLMKQRETGHISSFSNVHLIGNLIPQVNLTLAGETAFSILCRTGM